MNIKSLILASAILGLSSGIVLAKQEVKDQATVVKEGVSTKAVEVGNKTCPVSGDKIPAPGEKGTMGDNPVKIEYKGKIYNLCCPMCVKDFKKNPKKYSAIADKEVNNSKK